MASVQHTVTGTADPANAPPSIGAHYVDTATGRKWISTGVASVADWGRPLPGGVQIFGTDVANVQLPTDGTVSIWRVNLNGDRALVLQAPEAAGLYVAELIVENVQANFLTITAYRTGGALVNFEALDLGPAESRYFRFHCWVGVDGYPYWTLVENRSLNLKVEAVSSFSNNTTNLPFVGDQPMTFWSIGDATARTITFSKIDTYTAATRDLVITNGTSSAMAIAVSPDGSQLKDNSSLSVPANGAVLFRLAFNAANGGRWSLISSTDL